MGDIALVFLMGLFGSIHCVAMCGGLVMACSMRFGGGPSFSVKYNLGRVFMYALLGLVMGFLGSSLIAAGSFGRFQSVMPVVAGAFMVLVGLDMLGLTPGPIKRFFARLAFTPLSGVFKRAGLLNSGAAPFFVGMLNGLVPCALLYAVGVKAASTADPVMGATIMAALGAGNFLPMLFAGSLSSLLRKRAAVFTAASALLIIVLGAKSIAIGTGYLHTHHMHVAEAAHLVHNH